MRQWIDMTALMESSDLVPAYRGVPANGHSLDTTFGLFFSDTRRVAASYAGSSGKVVEVMLDISRALHWTSEVTEKFQSYVISWRNENRLPAGARKALGRFNEVWDTNITMAKAIGALLREPPSQIGHIEIDPLMGFVRAFVKERDYDVVVRPHESGGGMKDGTKEYIVFSMARITVPKDK